MHIIMCGENDEEINHIIYYLDLPTIIVTTWNYCYGGNGGNMYLCMCNMYDKRPYDISCICVYVYMFNAEGCNLSPLGTGAQSELNYEHTMRTAVANRWYLLAKKKL